MLDTDGTDLPKKIERHVWMWHADEGYIRPAIREPGRIYCLDKGTHMQCLCKSFHFHDQCSIEIFQQPK